MSLAVIHYPQTTSFFGDKDVFEFTEKMAKRGWFAAGRPLYMADHYRAAADMVIRWALGDSDHCNVEIDEWFPTPSEKHRLFEILEMAKPNLLEIGRLQKLGAWLTLKGPTSDL